MANEDKQNLMAEVRNKLESEELKTIFDEYCKASKAHLGKFLENPETDWEAVLTKWRARKEAKNTAPRKTAKNQFKTLPFYKQLTEIEKVIDSETDVEIKKNYASNLLKFAKVVSEKIESEINHRTKEIVKSVPLEELKKIVAEMEAIDQKEAKQ